MSGCLDWEGTQDLAGESVAIFTLLTDLILTPTQFVLPQLLPSSSIPQKLHCSLAVQLILPLSSSTLSSSSHKGQHWHFLHTGRCRHLIYKTCFSCMFMRPIVSVRAPASLPTPTTPTNSLTTNADLPTRIFRGKCWQRC